MAMNVRDARSGVRRQFSCDKSARSMTTCSTAEAEHSDTGALVHWVRTQSRSALLLTPLLSHRGSPQITPEPGSSSARDAGSATAAPPRVQMLLTSSRQALLAELERRVVFGKLVETLRSLMRQPHPRTQTAPLGRTAEIEELPARWVMQSVGSLPDAAPDAPGSPLTRRTLSPDVPPVPPPPPLPLLERVSVTARDVGATVVYRSEADAPASGAAKRFVITRTAAMAAGQYWVELTPLADTLRGTRVTVARVDREAVQLCPPLPTHFDTFLPCDDAFSPRGTSACVYLAALLAANGHGIGRTRARGDGQERRVRVRRGTDPRHARASGSDGSDDVTTDSGPADGDKDGDATRAEESSETTAARIAGTMATAAAAARATLAQALARPAPLTTLDRTIVYARLGDGSGASGTEDVVTLSTSPTFDDDAGATALQADGTHRCPTFTVRVLRRTVCKLAGMYDAQIRRGSCAAIPLEPSSSSNAKENSSNSSSSSRTAANNSSSRGPCHPTDGAGSCERQDDRAMPATLAEELVVSSRVEALLSDTTAAAGDDADAPAADGVAASFSRRVLAEPRLQLFVTRLYTMLLRYHLLFGEAGYNQGPQAAIPPSVMASLHRRFDVHAEAFASPLNAQLPQYGSLFPDTDAPFGSIGSFADVDFLAGHVEVNPPFDAVVMDKMQQRLLAALTDRETAPQSLLFVVVLPSHDPNAGRAGGAAAGAGGPASLATRRLARAPAPAKASAERVLLESRFCFAQTLCSADESAYVDGHQHLLRAPFFCINTPTRLMVLGNAAARQRYADAAARLEQVRADWRTLTTVELL